MWRVAHFGGRWFGLFRSICMVREYTINKQERQDQERARIRLGLEKEEE